MHGTIKLERWRPFQAEEVIHSERGMVWNARTRMGGIPVRGTDRFLDGAGAMRWTLLGLLPVMTASGPDITRSAAGRLAAEFCWLPSRLCGPGVSWADAGPGRVRADLAVCGEKAELTLTVDDVGRLLSLSLSRWGNPGGGRFHSAVFGGSVQEEKRFGGYTVPIRLRVGWDFGTDRFETSGEFLRVVIDEAAFR